MEDIMGRKSFEETTYTLHLFVEMGGWAGHLCIIHISLSDFDFLRVSSVGLVMDKI